MFLTILAAAIALLISERLRPDMVALLIVLALAYGRILSTDEAFSGLKSEPAVVIACMFVLSAGLQTTGLSEMVGRAIGNLAGRALLRMLALRSLLWLGTPSTFGGYRFSDYARVGAPLTLLLGIATAFLAPLVWPA